MTSAARRTMRRMTSGGIAAGFTAEILFRRCPACSQITIVRDGDLVCAFCDAELPAAWNIEP